MGNAAQDGAGVAPVNGGNGQGSGGSTCWIFLVIGYASLSLQPRRLRGSALDVLGSYQEGTQVNTSCSHRPAAASQSFIRSWNTRPLVHSVYLRRGRGTHYVPGIEPRPLGKRWGGRQSRPCRASPSWCKPQAEIHKPIFARAGSRKADFHKTVKKSLFQGQNQSYIPSEDLQPQRSSSFSSPTGRETPASMEKKMF